MVTLWSCIRRDIGFRHRLLYPNGSGPWGWLRASVLSRGLLVLAVHRLSHAAHNAKLERRRGGRALAWAASLARRMVLIAAKAHVANSTRVAPGVSLPDGGHIVIGPLEIGPGTVIHPRVTIGMGVLDRGRPRIGADVWIGPDCIIYGGIVVGDGATLLPGTVITKNVPPGAVMAGNPPRLVATAIDNPRLRASLTVARPERLLAGS